MRVARSADIPFEQFSGHREGEIKFCRLLQGEAGTPGNFELSLVRTIGDYFTPRHRHNFDQVRLTVEGDFSYGRGKSSPEGEIVYYPEGAFYGPQSVTGDPLILLLQAGGASGDGFLTYDEVARGYRELIQMGEFRDGTFHGTDPDTGKARNQDGYEAVWQQVTGRELSYPAPRYPEPVPMDPAAYAWIDDPSQPGVVSKLLGVFHERGLSLRFVRVAAGATFSVGDLSSPELDFVTRGALNVDGQPVGERDAFMLEAGDAGTTVEAGEESELFVIGLPVFTPAVASTRSLVGV